MFNLHPITKALLRVSLILSLWLSVAAGLWLALASPTLAAGNIIRVTTTGDPGDDGSDWTTNATTLQNALSIATPGDQIWVATGVYTPGLTESDTFTLTSGIQLYGGFAGTESDPADRDWAANPTILSGDIDNNDTNTNGVVLTSTDIAGNNSYHVIYADGASGTVITESTVLDGFTITAGQADGSSPNFRGGGFYCDGQGTGNACSPTLRNVTFSANSADDDGGAMFNNGSYTGSSSPQLSNVSFSANSANRGGAMANNGSYTGSSSPQLSNVSFSANWAQENAGAMFNLGFKGQSSPNLSNVTFSGNSSDYGGAMLNNGSSGGQSSPQLTNVSFSGNSASVWGGAMYNSGSNGQSSPQMTNVILWGNTATNSSGAMYNSSASPVLSYTLIQSGPGDINDANSSTTTFVSNILTSDPLFVDAANGDLRLQNGSPAIDAGLNGAIGLSTDLAGNARIQGGTADLGAYEGGYAPAPEIEVQGNGQTIPNGDTTPNTVDDTDFGPDAPVTHTFTISNSGDADLTLSGVGLLYGTAFTLTQPSSPVISNSSTTFEVVFNPALAGPFTDTVSIANNDSDENPYTFVISGTGLANDPPTVTAPVTGTTVATSTPTFEGTGEAGATIRITNGNGNEICTTTVDSNSDWSCTPSLPLPDGGQTVDVTQTDPAGNESDLTDVTFTVDSGDVTAPDAPVVTAPVTGTTVATNTPTFEGTGEPGATISIKDDSGTEICTTTVDINSDWSCTPSLPLPDGGQTVDVTQTDPAGNESDLTDVTFTVDSGDVTAPDAPVVTAPVTGTTVATNTPTFEGTGEPGATISIKDDGGNTICTTTVDSNGDWSCIPTTPLPNGEQTVNVTQTANNSESNPIPVTFTVDTTVSSPAVGGVAEVITLPEQSVVPTRLVMLVVGLMLLLGGGLLLLRRA